MKKILLFTLVAGMTLCYTSCSSDDDNDGSDKTNIGNTVVGKTDAQAAHYNIPKASAPAATTEDGREANITGFNVTEYEQAVLEVDVDGVKKYRTYDVSVKDNIYTLSEAGRVIGTVTKVTSRNAATRAESTVGLVFKVAINIEIDGEMVPLTFDYDDPIEAQEVIETKVKEITNQLTNTWTIERMKLVLVFDDKNKSDASTTTQGGDLVPFIDLAKRNDVEISEQDEKDLTRTIQSIIIDKGYLFVMKYADGRSDAATWGWTSEKEGSLAISVTLRDDEMGNKFFNNDSKIAVELRADNKINLIMQTRLEDDKCTASLIVNLK